MLWFNIYTEIWYYNYKEHCVTCVRIRSFSGPYFPAFRLDTKRYSVSFRIQSKWGKIRTIKTPNTDTFHAVELIESVRDFQRRIQNPIKHVKWSVFRFSHIVRYLQGILGLQKKQDTSLLFISFLIIFFSFPSQTDKVYWPVMFYLSFSCLFLRTGFSQWHYSASFY